MLATYAPRDLADIQARSASSVYAKPLTNERFRIIELYAELLHSSNMSILNRVPGTGPTYSSEGVLSGGLISLEALGEAIDGDRAGEDDEPIVEDQVTQARELPVSTGSTDTSMSDVSEDDVSLDDVEDMPSPQPPSSNPTPDLQEHHPPPPSQADVARLRDVMTTESRPTPSETSDVDMASVSHMAVAATTAAPSVASDTDSVRGDPSTIKSSSDDRLAPGERLKRKYLEHSVIPAIVDLFFEYPHNDFAHHVIYDILQQIMNGRLSPCLNRDLAVQLIRDARLVERVMDAYRVNDRLS
jgi:SIT4-associating protein SAP185/190